MILKSGRNVVFPTKYEYLDTDVSDIFKNHEILIRKVFNKTTIRECLRRTRRDITRQLDASESAKHSYRTALKSDMFSSSLGYHIAEVIRDKYGIYVEISGNDDSKPDLFFVMEKLPMEIKATVGDSWTGGEFSDRPYPTILVSYNWEESSYFVCIIPIIKKWKSNIEKRRYGTKLSWKAVRESKKVLLFGNIVKIDTKTGRSIKGKLVREKL